MDELACSVTSHTSLEGTVPILNLRHPFQTVPVLSHIHKNVIFYFYVNNYFTMYGFSNKIYVNEV